MSKFVLVVNNVSAGLLAQVTEAQAKSENRVRLIPEGNQNNGTNLEVVTRPMTATAKKPGMFDLVRIEWDEAGTLEATKLLEHFHRAAGTEVASS